MLFDEERIANEGEQQYFNNEIIRPNHEYQNIIFDETNYTDPLLLDPIPFIFPECDNYFYFQNKTKKEENKILAKKRGRKKKGSRETGKHDKYAHDIIIRKIKSVFFKYLIDIINNKIEQKYGKNFGKKLLQLNSDIIKSNVKENKILLKKKLKDILSGNISLKFTKPKYNNEYNKNLIQELYEKDKEFEEIFNLTFLDALKHFRASEGSEGIIEKLNGMKTLKDIPFSEDDDEKYKNYFKDFVNKFEDIINEKKERKSKKQ